MNGSDRSSQLYLDLMVKVLINTIYKDGNTNPRRDAAYDGELRQEGRDWPAVAHSMIGLRRMQNLRALTEMALARNIPGDFLEAGVWRGGAAIMMRAVLQAFDVRDRMVFCCDSYEGLPQPDAERYPADKDDKHHTVKNLVVSLEEVQQNFERYGLLDEQVIFVKGFFRDTLRHIPSDRFALIRLDGDMYESTIQCLEELYPKLSTGGFVIIDDFGAVPGCRTAVEDYRSSEKIFSPLQRIDWTGIWWQK